MPLVNSYKLLFLRARILQTLLGGLRLLFSYPVPWYIYFLQMICYLMPWMCGGFAVLLYELGILNITISCTLGGLLLTLSTAVLHIVSLKCSDIQHTNQHRRKNMLSEDDEINFESCLSANTLQFLVPAKNSFFVIVLHSTVAGLVCGLAVQFSCPTLLGEVFNTRIAVATVLHVLTWVSVCCGLNVLNVTSTPEVATYRTDHNLVLTPMSRSFYLIIPLILQFVYRYDSVM